MVLFIVSVIIVIIVCLVVGGITNDEETTAFFGVVVGLVMAVINIMSWVVGGDDTPTVVDNSPKPPAITLPSKNTELHKKLEAAKELLDEIKDDM